MKCPDCGRCKAENANDASNGYCPKWWAIMDKDADLDCINHKNKEDKLIKEQIEFIEWLKSEGIYNNFDSAVVMRGKHVVWQHAKNCYTPVPKPTKKIIKVDNFDRELFDDVLVADNMSDHYAESVAEMLNSKFSGDNSSYYYRVVDGDHELFKRDY